jgi:hypothetical protein
MKRTIKRILKEEYQLTETEYMGGIIPPHFLEELGIKLFNEDDVASLTEIQFDTKRVVIDLFTYDDNGDYISYEDSWDIPDGFQYQYGFNINDLPVSFIKFLLKELNDKYGTNYLYPFLDMIPKGMFKNL